MEKILILYSGGADSRLMLEFANKICLSPYCLLIDYEQLHVEELLAAEKQLQELDIPFQTVSIDNLKINSGLTGDGIKNRTGEVHEMHMPGRNSIFLSIAFSIAESRDIDTIWIGCDWSDRLSLFPDCYQEYLVKINEMFKIAGPRPIKVEAPLMGLSKENVLKLLKSFGVEEKDIFSGYGDLNKKV
jgi:7-cyano-7-deazaguanine synthase